MFSGCANASSSTAASTTAAAASTAAAAAAPRGTSAAVWPALSPTAPRPTDPRAAAAGCQPHDRVPSAHPCVCQDGCAPPGGGV